MAFNLTSTQQASQGFIHPELTNCPLLIALKLSAAWPTILKYSMLAKKLAQFLWIMRAVLKKLTF